MIPEFSTEVLKHRRRLKNLRFLSEDECLSYMYMVYLHCKDNFDPQRSKWKTYYANMLYFLSERETSIWWLRSQSKLRNRRPKAKTKPLEPYRSPPMNEKLQELISELGNEKYKDALLLGSTGYIQKYRVSKQRHNQVKKKAIALLKVRIERAKLEREDFLARERELVYLPIFFDPVGEQARRLGTAVHGRTQRPAKCSNGRRYCIRRDS